MNDCSVALVDVVAVELTDQAKTIVLRWRQHEFACAEGVEANGWKRDLARLLCTIVGDVNNGANLRTTVY